MEKKAFEFSFGWMFAVIVGAVVIFLAIYSVTRFVETERIVQNTEIGKELGIILHPLETNIESGAVGKIILKTETKLFNECSETGNFGRQGIRVSSDFGIKGSVEGGISSSFKSRYIFSSSVVQGKEYLVFSKPLNMPFKIADLMFILSEKDRYCFIDTPTEIMDEIEGLNIDRIELNSSVKDCSVNSVSVCFSSGDCDIKVIFTDNRYFQGSVQKKFAEKVYFSDVSLMYGAIFADPELYECQIKRLMKRASELSLLYYSKSLFLSSKGCNSNLEIELARYANMSFSVEDSFDIIDLSRQSKIIKEKNDDLSCELF